MPGSSKTPAGDGGTGGTGFGPSVTPAGLKGGGAGSGSSPPSGIMTPKVTDNAGILGGK